MGLSFQRAFGCIFLPPRMSIPPNINTYVLAVYRLFSCFVQYGTHVSGLPTYLQRTLLCFGAKPRQHHELISTMVLSLFPRCPLLPWRVPSFRDARCALCSLSLSLAFVYISRPLSCRTYSAEGGIPSDIGVLSSLRTVHLNNNQLTGALPILCP